ENIDIAPTIEQMLGVQIPATVQGTPLNLTTPTPVPTANNDSFTVPFNAPATTLNVLANDSANVAGGKVGIVSTTTAAHGTVTVDSDGTTLKYKPDVGYRGTDSFTVTVSGAVQVATVPRETLGMVGTTPVFDGFGSAVAAVPGTTDQFYSMTDRGPNVD